VSDRTGWDALNRLAKWRTVFAGWQLGTRAKGDPESDAVRDHREATLLMRAELSALASLLIEKKVFTREEFDAACIVEADHLNDALAARFPGITATEYGLRIEPEAAAYMKDWPQ
jgi:hypothetical protein